MQFVDELTISAVSLYRYHIALTPTLPVAKQRIDHRQGLVLLTSVINSNQQDQQVWVEIAPLSGIDTEGLAIEGFSQESLDEVITALPQIAQQLIGKSPNALMALAATSTFASVAFGLSLLHAKLCHQLPCRIEIPNTQSVTVPLVYSGMSEQQLQTKLHQNGSINSVKVKVAQTSMEDEIAFVYRVLTLAPQVSLRLDANRGFTPEQAIDFLACLPKDKIEFIEEPCINPADNPLIYQQLGVRYALDESLNSATFDVINAIKQQAGIAALVIKPMLLGSLTDLQHLIDAAHIEGVRCILSSSLESDIGITDLRLLSQALTPNETPGLDTLGAFSQLLLIDSTPSSKLNVNALQLVYHAGNIDKTTTAL
ncbi:o-succinylbenzoate synthase [Shewanella inventionis]|uniref:o-succinylbenzoate synthase n=1 Tax=Shewanella inventionis TaxID=1738770 RepID=A0ABQ1IKH3_9GAMM|nr:o-succinylbenzoate synthase [Shewanella inventionis]MCL1156383.1 o-succinylbenzoate synthase [Shewanella inventionis]GGB45111.1 o-succinylbenzoate synthase [Shewanella inventionis]